MSRLVFNVGLMARVSSTGPTELPCRFEDELRYSARIDQEVLLAGQPAPGTPAEYFATATLAGFVTTAAGVTLAQLTQIRFLPHPAQAFALPAFIGEIDATHLPQLATAADGLDEAGQGFAPLDVYAAIGHQLAERQDHVCSFSGVRISDGMGAATPIRPRPAGGAIHVRNCLFLHDEPATLFSRLAWTVGPDFEIIIDSWAVGAEILGTLNPTGKLALSQDPAWWPDPEALAWHRAQFHQRLK